MALKHCFGILAHSNFEYLKQLISSLIVLNGLILIHIDKRVNDESLGLVKQEFKGNLRVVFIQSRIKSDRRYFSVVKASNNIIKESFKYEWDYFHLISGSDLLIKNIDYFNRFFKVHQGLNFMDIQKLPLTREYGAWEEADESVLHKIDSEFIGEDMYFYDKIPKINYVNRNTDFNEYNMVRRIHTPITDFLYSKMQFSKRLFPRKRVLDLLFTTQNTTKLAYGSAWFTITKEIAAVIYKEILNKKYDSALRYSIFPSEIYYQTIIINSLTEEEIKEKFVISDLRYVNWNRQTNWRLDLLDKDEIKKALNHSLAIFARKVW